MQVADRDDVAAYLAKVPGARPEWIDTLSVAKVSMGAVEAFVRTMVVDKDSPLRISSDILLSREIGRINGVFGDVNNRSEGNGRLLINVNVRLTRGECLRLDAVVGNFCQPKIISSRRFGQTGHAVARAARRCATGISLTKISLAGRILEVGADVKHWMTDVETREPYTATGWGYKSARPSLTKRDVVRMDWSMFSRIAKESRRCTYDAKVLDRIHMLEENYDDIFPNVRVQEVVSQHDYIVSNDANYDVQFSDMPAVMERTGAKAWFGYMNRVKGLTRSTRLNEGKLENLGYNYRVDWKKGKIVFRHPECAAFGYEHDVWSLMRYEEENGYVWHTQAANYVYTKGAETNDELLFFSVVRVTKAIYMQQPSFVDNPLAGMVSIESVWATGGVVDGVPTEFVPVKYSVDALCFSKVFEKRMAVDVRGDLAQTIGLVKSTNIRMWINGTPVGTDRRVQTQLIEATAVAVEVMAAEARARGSKVFAEAMGAYEMSKAKQSWVWRALESIVDLRAVCGTVAGPISRAWGELRGKLLDAALSPLTKFKVSVMKEEPHVLLPAGSQRLYGNEAIPGHLPAATFSGRQEGFVEATELPDEQSSDEDSSSKSLSGDTDITEITENFVEGSWSDESNSGRLEAKAMDEFVSLEKFIRRALHTETRVDASRLKNAKCRNDDDVLQWCTTRTQHTLVEFRAGREVRCMGNRNVEYGAVYDMEADKFVKVRRKGQVAYAPLTDGWYYTSNHMKVWNLEEILEAVEYAKAYGSALLRRSDLRFVLGVPGAGKTFRMMKKIAHMYMKGQRSFLVLSVTVKAKEEAVSMAIEFGVPENIAIARIRTLDGYLVSMKSAADYVAIDEFPMAHAGKIDAAIAIAEAKEVWLYGDGRQIPYDPFTVGHECKYASFSDGIDEGKLEFLSVSHRLSKDACAAWVDVYPEITSCECCRVGEKGLRTLSWSGGSTMAGVVCDKTVRYHAYTRAEADDLKDHLHLKLSRDKLKIMKNSGLSTVHEDQGATHDKVFTVRSAADYDKNASRRNPSLYNRLTYVLTDMTRHKRGYHYYTLSKERDMVVSRVECATHDWRLEAVEKGEKLGLSTLADMLSNRYHPDIASGATLKENYKPPSHWIA